MSFLPVYLDSSALLKLILPEPESAALEKELQRWPDWLSSALAAIECRRVLTRIHAPAAASDRARCVFEMTTLLRLDEPVLRLAEHVGPPVLRSRDAIHLPRPSRSATSPRRSSRTTTASRPPRRR